MARRKKSAEENARRGNPGRRKNPIASISTLPTLEVMPPADISSDGRAVWMMVAPDLIALKILRRTDALTFMIFCESFAEYCKARRDLDREGYTYEAETIAGGTMRRVNPLYLVIERSRRIVLQYAAQFGLTPSDRMRVMQYLAGGAALPPDPRNHPPASNAHHDDGNGVLDLDAAAASLPDAGPIGALN